MTNTADIAVAPGPQAGQGASPCDQADRPERTAGPEANPSESPNDPATKAEQLPVKPAERDGDEAEIDAVFQSWFEMLGLRDWLMPQNVEPEDANGSGGVSALFAPEVATASAAPPPASTTGNTSAEIAAPAPSPPSIQRDEQHNVLAALETFVMQRGGTAFSVPIPPPKTSASTVPGVGLYDSAIDPFIHAVDPYAREEGLEVGYFVVTRTAPFEVPLTVFYTVGGTATPGIDYVALSGSVTFQPGAETAQITVQPLQDTLEEPPETVVVTLTPHPSYVLSPPTQATVTIIDNEVFVSVEATDSTAAEEGLDPAIITFMRFGGDISQAETVYFFVDGFSAAGLDYSGVIEGLQSIVIPAFQSSATLTITPIDDDAYEEDELVEIFLVEGMGAYALGNPDRVSVTIADNDAAPPEPPTKKMKDPQQQGNFEVVGPGLGNGQPTRPVAYGEKTLNNDNVGADEANAKDNFVSFNPVIFKANLVIDMVFQVRNTNGITEFRIEYIAGNHTDEKWTGIQFELGFGKWTPAADNFVKSANDDDDDLDFDTPDEDPPPRERQNRLDNDSLIHGADTLVWTKGDVPKDGTTESRAAIWFQIDIPDWNNKMPESAKTADGYKFTLRAKPVPAA